MNKQPQIIINAADLTPEQLREWILKITDDAKKADLVYEITSMKLISAKRSLLDVASDLECRIDFLSSDQIIFPKEQYGAIQKELLTLNAALAAVRAALNELSSAFDILDNSSETEAVR